MSVWPIFQKHVAAVSTQAINNEMDDFNDNFFDYILIGHYAELVENPKEFLKTIGRKLKPGGWMIATVQNVMHYGVIRDLLNGHWFFRTIYATIPTRRTIR